MADLEIFEGGFTGCNNLSHAHFETLRGYTYMYVASSPGHTRLLSPNIMGLSYVHESPNIMGLMYYISIMGLSYESTIV